LGGPELGRMVGVPFLIERGFIRQERGVPAAGASLSPVLSY